MRVLHIASTYACGGIATSLWHLLPALNNEPDSTVEAAVFYEKGWFGDLLQESGIQVHEFGLTQKYDPRVLIKLINLVKKYEVVHAHGWPVIFFVALTSLVVRKPHYIVSEHSVTNRRRRLFFKWIDHFLYGRFDRIVAVSNAVADSLVEWQPQTSNKISVVYNSVDDRKILTRETRETFRDRLNLAHNTPVIFASGNFRVAKGFDLLIRAFEIVLKENRKKLISGEELPILVITGEGTLNGPIVDLAEELELSDQIRFLGFRTDMPELLLAADVFVLSSRWEGCPMVIIESMALGVPILATHAGGVPELVINGETGIVIPQLDPQTIAHFINEFFENPEKASCLANQGLKRFKRHFSIDQAVSAFNNLYQGLENPLI